MGASFAAFCGVVVLVVVTPGQDTALTIRNTLAGGRRGGIFSALGIVTGQATWTLATAAGLSALLVGSSRAFFVLKLVGAAYLLYLGTRALWGALRTTSVASPTPRERAAPQAVAAYRQGLLSNLGNAKIAAFFTTLLPQFAPDKSASFGDFVALGLVLCACTLVWLTLYACVVARTADALRAPRVRRWLEGLTGAALVALGVRVALEHR
jgi:threonine/homoserine/homoserine lactone efflux protein